MIGWDTATCHRENACEGEHRQQAEAERQWIRTKLKQGQEMGLKPGNMMHGDLTGRPSGLAVLSIPFVYFAGAGDNVTNKGKMKPQIRKKKKKVFVTHASLTLKRGPVAGGWFKAEICQLTVGP